MSIRSLVLQLREDNPDACFAELARMAGCEFNTVKYHLRPEIKAEMVRKRTLANRAIMRDLKLAAGGACSICGYSKSLAALQFHHLDPDQKEFDVSQMGTNKEARIREAKKCILVCANCHAEIHDKSGGG